MFSNGLLHMDIPGFVDQQRLIFIHSEQILDGVFKTYQKLRVIGIDEEIKARKSILLMKMDLMILIHGTRIIIFVPLIKQNMCQNSLPLLP